MTDPRVFYFVTNDELPFTVGGDYPWWVTAWDQLEPREYSMPPFAFAVSKESFDEIRNSILESKMKSVST